MGQGFDTKESIQSEIRRLTGDTYHNGVFKQWTKYCFSHAREKTPTTTYEAITSFFFSTDGNLYMTLHMYT